MVRDREGCRERIEGRPVPTRMIAASVTVTAERFIQLKTLFVIRVSLLFYHCFEIKIISFNYLLRAKLITAK